MRVLVELDPGYSFEALSLDVVGWVDLTVEASFTAVDRDESCSSS